MSAHAKTERELWLAGKRRQKKLANKSSVAPGRPKCPGHLCEAARQEFRRVSKLLGERGHETLGDATVLALYASVYSRWVRNKAKLEREGDQITVEVFDNHGNAKSRTKENPLLEIVERAEKQLFVLSKELGLTPQSRSKIQPTESAGPEKRHPEPGCMWEQCPHLFDDDGNYVGAQAHKEN